MGSLNCWEFKKCGRQPGGSKAGEMGVCPSATLRALDGAHGGKNGGRACWAVAGTLCGGKVQGTFAAKAASCQQCDFYQMVRKDEGTGFIGASALLKRIA